MSSIVKKHFFKRLLCGGALIGSLVFCLFADSSAILIESLESKTSEGSAVFNSIQLKRQNGQDIWLMEQSHAGSKLPKKYWDKLAIVVDEGMNGEKRAQFSQLKSGPEVISHHLSSTDFKVSCYFCHSNGPRAIRPNWASKEAPINLWNRARIFLWNIRIKTYGLVRGEGRESQRAFRHPGKLANEVLRVKTCQLCHTEKAWFSRGELTKQNFMAIRFMVKNQLMPPPGFSLSDDEKKQIEAFVSFRK